MAVAQLQNSVSVMRKELKNLRKQVESMRHMLRSEALAIRQTLCSSAVQHHTSPQDSRTSNPPTPTIPDSIPSSKTHRRVESGALHSTISYLSDMAIGTIRTCFHEKNGTPRQPGLCPSTTGTLQVETFTNPSHSLDGLEEYSHVWLLFVFHKNKQDSVKAKVKPPRLNGEKRGVFATRSPHRPCPVGLSLAKIEKVVGSTLHVSGIDLIDGTPVLDLKPYIPAYDSPGTCPNTVGVGGQAGKGSEIRVATWLGCPPVPALEVRFTKEAEQQLSLFQCQHHPPEASGDVSSQLPVDSLKEVSSGEVKSSRDSPECTLEDSPFLLESFHSLRDARAAIVDILEQDPRSVYRRDKCSQETYKFSIDNLNLSCQFLKGVAVVTDIQPKMHWNHGDTDNR